MKILRRFSAVCFSLLFFAFVLPALARQPRAVASGAGSIEVVADTTVHLLVTGPYGSKTGYDPSSNQDVNQIPSSDYYTGGGYAADAGGKGSTPSYKRLYIGSPTTGEYILDVIGARSGTFKVQVIVYDAKGKQSGASFVGTAALGKTFFYTIRYSASSPARIDSLVPFSSLDADVNVYAGQTPSFSVSAQISPGPGSAGINPLTDPFYFQLASYSVTLPPGSFVEDKQGNYNFHGMVQGVPLVVSIAPEQGGNFALHLKAQIIDLSAAINPLHLTVFLGRNAGAGLFNATVR